MEKDSDTENRKVKKVDADNRLTNWSKWQDTWKSVEGTIAEKLNVESEDLLMNYASEIYVINEEKKVLEYAKIPTEFDKYRGKPDFYKLPNSLPKKMSCSIGQSRVRCYCGPSCYCRNEPTYYAVKSKQEAYIVPNVDLIGPSIEFLNKKNIRSETRNMYKKWQNSKYRQFQMVHLNDKIQNIVPHWPEFKKLIVVGKKIARVQTEDEIPQVSEADLQQDIPKTEKISKLTPKESVRFKRPRRRLEVNGIVLSENCNDKGTRKLRLFFEYDITSSQPSIHFLSFKNEGTATVRISWKKIEKFRLLRNYSGEKLNKREFYFDKRELVILPDRSFDLPVIFKTETSGNYSESWQLITAPNVCNEDLQVILILESYAYYEDMKETVRSIIDHIDIRAKDLLIRDMLDEILERVKYPHAPVPSCIFGEAELFELANLVNGRPVLLYNTEFVDELKQMYEKVKSEEIDWDYSISKLKKLVHVKDIHIYLENKRAAIVESISRMENSKAVPVSSLKKQSSMSEGKVKASKEKVDKSLEKPSAKGSKENQQLKRDKNIAKSVSNILPSEQSRNEIREFKRELFVYSNQLELENVLNKFDSPIIVNSERDKYFACFTVLNAYFNLMCQHLEILEREVDFVKEQHYPPTKNRLIPMDEQPERLVYEYFENHHVPPRFLDEIYSFEVKRKPITVRDIPSDDIEKLHEVYFPKQYLKKQGSQIKPGKKEPKASKSKESKIKQKSKSSVKEGKTKQESPPPKEARKTTSKEIDVKKEISIESFDPYAEYFSYISESAERVVPPPTQKARSLTKVEKKDYDYRQYLIVYSYLCDAVDAIVDTVQSFECVVSYPTLKVMKSQFPKFDGEE